VNTTYLHKASFQHLNKEQQKAILTSKGRILILAGAGTGKTSTLAYRTAHLIENEQVPPSSILGLTFTNKAAQEMKERIGNIVSKEKAKHLTLCTFHSFCMQILREHIEKLGFTKHFSLYDEKDMKRLATQLTQSILEHEGKLPSLDASMALLRDLQYKGLESHEELSYESSWQKQFIKDLYQNLEVSLRAYNAVDFDSLISLSVKLFRTHPEVLAEYQQRYHYIMVDEYQDTNPIQYELAHLLSASHRNLCVVGDDDQSIYGWRGAEVKHILEFNYDTLIKLEQNYRSSKNILEAANSVIKHNTHRHPKTLWSHKASEHPIILFHAPTEQEEAQAVIQRILELKTTHSYKWKDFAILYRSNQLSRPFEGALTEARFKKDGSWQRGIPYEVFGGLELYERSEIKDLLAYLKVIANPQDQEALLRIINYPRRGISENTLDLLTSRNRLLKISLWSLLEHVAQDSLEEQELIEALTPKAYQSLRSFVSLIQTAKEKFAHEPLHASLQWLVEAIDYKTAIFQEVKSEKMQDFKWENVEECIRLLKSYEEDPESPGTLHDFLSTTLLDEKALPKAAGPSHDYVNLMTFHSAKGLEFPVCFLVGLEDHIIPHERSLLDRGLEEERRLMYVALTRCKERLYLSMARARNKHGKTIQSAPSRFLFEIPKELITLVSWKSTEAE
jgi:superfamily I DNA/RNA helicase